jgi:FdhD protein
MSDSNHHIQYLLIENNTYIKVDTAIVTESAFTLTVNGDIWISFTCTPVEIEALAIGFLYNEGLISSIDDIASIRVCQTSNNIDVWLSINLEKPTYWKRTSGCAGGVTSIQKETMPEDTINKAIIIDKFKLNQTQVNELVNQFYKAQELYPITGGIHTSALGDRNTLLVVTEDIGRHNTLDKIAGLCLLDHISLDQNILITTGRVSSEMMQKAIRLNSCIVISRTAPTSLSVQMAERNGVTLIGYARRNSFRIYSHPERIIE